MMQHTPRPEYPRPQMARASWLNLNGVWEFAFDFGNSGVERGMFREDATAFDRRILVPFCPESKLSGIGYTDFITGVWYRRTVALDAAQLAGRVLLHFGAVDYHCEVWINGVSCGVHDGGYASFSFDVTRLVRAGDNVLTVYAEDFTRTANQPKGKQSERYHSAGCSYTRTTGIWQTVWLEFVPDTYIQSYKVEPQPADGSAAFQVWTSSCLDAAAVRLTALLDGAPVGAVCVRFRGDTARAVLPLDELRLWEPGSPVLYDLTIELLDGERVVDCVHGYFGMRDLAVRDGALWLNGRPLYQRLVLDQGFHPDGIYTYPDDASLRRDIELSMALGFNGARLHQRVFEERTLYWADKLGYLVWGEHASWGLDVRKPEALTHFLPEWLACVRRDWNHPALIGWCPLNETWSAEQDPLIARTLYQATKAVDPTRPVIDASGGNHYQTDLYDIHCYEQDPEAFLEKFAPMLNGGEAFDPNTTHPCYAGQPYFVSEYGGTWWNPEEAARRAANSGWGYGAQPRSEQEVCDRYVGLTHVLLAHPGICGFCYTQLTDVEQEQNGLYRYDRSPKFSEETYARIRAANLEKAAIE